MKLTPIGKKIQFQFLDRAAMIDGRQGFEERTEAGIVYKNYEKSIMSPRWGRVLAVGPDVDPQIKVGSLILIENLGWTTAVRLQGMEPFWMTREDKVLAYQDPE
jgi:co-chaperonin GroES (HSP10)